MPEPYSRLLVDDSPMMRQFVTFALTHVKDFHVTEAEDGTDALRKLACNKYDIIMTDINMPVMDGYKLIKRVRTDPVHKDTPLTVIASEGTEDVARALDLGANAVLGKPLKAPAVLAKTKELLRIA